MRIISKYILFTLFAFSVFISLSRAQTREADSLKNLLSETLTDNERVNVLQELSLALNSFAPDSSLLLASEALKLSKKLGDQSTTHKSKEVAGIAFQALGDYDTAWSIFKDLQQKSWQIEDSALLATSLFEQGRINRAKGNNKAALDSLNKALSIRRALKDEAGIADVLNQLGNINASLGNYSRALEVYQQAMIIDQKINDKVGLSDRYNNIARIYIFRKNFEKAAEYFMKSYEISIDLNDRFGQRILTNNIAFTLRKQGKHDEALEYLFKSLRIHKEINEVCGDIYPTYNVGSIYVITNRLDSAETYLKRALQRAQECNDQYLVCLSYIDLGKLYIKKNKLRAAKTALHNAYNNANSRGLIAEAKDASKELSIVYEQLGQPTLSLKYFKIYHLLYDSLFNEENTTRFARLEAEFEFQQEKQKEALNRRLKELEKEKQLNQAIWVRNSFIAAFLLLAVFLFLTYRNYVRKNKANTQLNELNKKISRQKDTLAEQAAELRSANEEIRIINENLESIVKERTKVITDQNKKILEYVFYNSHQVRGPLARILGLVALFEKKVIKAEEMQDKLYEIRKEAQDLDTMVKKMNRTLEEGKKSLEEEN